MHVAKHLDLAATASVSSAGGLGCSAWQLDGFYTVSEGTRMSACLCACMSTHKCQG